MNLTVSLALSARISLISAEARMALHKQSKAFLRPLLTSVFASPPDALDLSRCTRVSYHEPTSGRAKSTLYDFRCKLD